MAGLGMNVHGWAGHECAWLDMSVHGWARHECAWLDMSRATHVQEAKEEHEGGQEK
jgi:hypothetical protein